MITVIIPSFNRAHLLHKTIPSYCQTLVSRIILVDDCSSDNTTEVVAELQKQISILEYIRLPKNSRQPTAQNVALEKVDTEWVYFGDDDSVLYPNTIQRLFDTIAEHKADICGAKALYMAFGDSLDDIDGFVERSHKILPKDLPIVELDTLKVHFDSFVEKPIEVPFCHASALVNTELAKKVMFDPMYVGNAYREETDFFMGCSKIGAKIMYDSRAMQINLPPNLATGGARSSTKMKYRYYMIVNNWRFLNKHYSFLKQKYGLRSNKYAMQFQFMISFVSRAFKRVLN